MAPTLGKRKREVAGHSKIAKGKVEEPSDSTHEDAQAILRRHFEARFLPIDVPVKRAEPKPRLEAESQSEEDEESEWDGISDAEDTKIEVIEHTATKEDGIMSREELKSFMSSKPPPITTSTDTRKTKKGKKAADDAEDDDTEAANLKHDLALQRFLAESHLLESSSNPTLSGKNRHVATDMRLQTLGAKSSLLKQEKMPMSHRKGITAKKLEREEIRRREARENGIILERQKAAKAKTAGKRDTGVGAPAVGRFAGGTLSLSKRDIMDIEGPKKSFGSRGGKGSRGRGRGRR